MSACPSIALSKMNAPTQVPNRLYNVCKSHPVVINNIPEEPEKGYHTIPIEDRSLAEQIAYSGMFKKIGYCNGDHPNCDNIEWRCKSRIWTLTDAGKNAIEAIDEPETLPCNHQGLHTLIAGEEYTCTNEDCDATFPRSVAEKVTF